VQNTILAIDYLMATWPGVWPLIATAVMPGATTAPGSKVCTLSGDGLHQRCDIAWLCMKTHSAFDMRTRLWEGRRRLQWRDRLYGHHANG
jgi:hypothetical protein